MPDPAHVGRKRLACPSFTTQSKLVLRSEFCGADEKFLYAPLAVRQAISDKHKITGKRGACRYSVVRRRINGIVDRMAIGCSQPHVMVYHGWATAISKDKVVLWNQCPERVLRIFLHSRQSCGRIYIPESNFGCLGPAVQNSGFQQFIKYADAAVLDD